MNEIFNGTNYDFKTARRFMQLSCADVAAAANLGRHAVVDYERGKTLAHHEKLWQTLREMPVYDLPERMTAWRRGRTLKAVAGLAGVHWNSWMRIEKRRGFRASPEMTRKIERLISSEGE